MIKVNYEIVIKNLAWQWHLNEGQYHCLLQLESDAVSDLLQIDTTLNQLFAGNPWLAELWMTTHNQALGGASPMDVIEAGGMSGLKKVVKLLCL